MSNDLQIHSETQSQGFRRQSETLTVELAKMLSLVAPVTMSEDQHTAWLASAVDALQDIRAEEVQAVSLEIRRSVTRPSQIIPEIARLVAERRASRTRQERAIAEEQATVALLPAKKHIMDRDRSRFTAADWAELNEYLESQGSKVRYSPQGKRMEAA